MLCTKIFTDGNLFGLTTGGHINMWYGMVINPILDVLIDVSLKVLPAIIGFIAFRKGWAFIKSAIQGA